MKMTNQDFIQLLLLFGILNLTIKEFWESMNNTFILSLKKFQ